MKNPNEAVFTHTFNAPRDLVWQVYTDIGRLKEWMGFTYAKMDFRVGGRLHYAMKQGDGPEMWGIWTVHEINPPMKLVIIQSFSDKDGGITAHPMAPTWPKKMLSISTFEESNGKTMLTIRWEPFEATAEEIATFNGARSGMEQGWSAAFSDLGDYLTKIQK